MRRKDREITENQTIQEIISKCDCCRLAFCDHGVPYIVPMNFGYEQKNGKHFFYFHSANEGRKIELIKQGKTVGFELDTNHRLNESDQACGYSFRFQSVIGTGEVSFLTGGEKAHALEEIMVHNTHKSGWTFTPEMLNAVTVFQLTVSEWSCKEHL